MCGIIGIIDLTGKDSVKNTFNGLKLLEYRGYDSFGLAWVDKKIKVKKDKGMISNEKVPKEVSPVSMGHIRWATHGKPSKINAHPHLSCDEKIALVHNGIIENYQELKKELKGHKIISQTDSEIIVHLLEQELKKEKKLEKAFFNVLKKLKGSFALVVLYDNKIIAARKESPLVLGFNSKENMVASDLNAFDDRANKFHSMEDNQMAVIAKDGVKLFEFMKKKKLKLKLEIVKGTKEEIVLHGFKHYMLKEIMEEPSVIRRILNEHVVNGEIKFKLKKFNKIYLIGCGTSYHACLLGEKYLEKIARINSKAVLAPEFLYGNPLLDKNTLVIALSQSGETADTLKAIRKAKKEKAKVLSIINVEKSSIQRESNHSINMNAGIEVSVASTKAFIAQITLLLLLSMYFGTDKKLVKKMLIGLREIPGKMEKMLAKNNMKKAVEWLAKANNSLYLGRTINYPIALEGALKLKEISYVHAEGYASAEMKHGPIALIDKKFLTVIIAVNDGMLEKNLGNIFEIKARNGRVIAVSTKGNEIVKKVADVVLEVPETIELLYPFLSTSILQLLAYNVAVKMKKNVDKPRNL